MTNLPNGWERKPLHEVADVVLGQSPPGSSYNAEGDGMPFFQGKAEFGDLTPEVRKWTTSPKKLAKGGDVLISVRAPVGPTNLAPADCSIGRGLAALRPRNGMSSKYLLFAMRATVDQLAGQATGTTFPAISGAQLRAHRVPVAPLDEQHQIVEAIEEQFSRLDVGVDCLIRAKRNLIRIRNSSLTAAVEGSFAEGTTEWTSTTIGAVAKRIDYGTSAKASTSGDGAVAVLRMGNIQDGRFDLTDLKYLPADHPDVSRLSLDKGDLLFNRTNSAELVGKSAVVSESEEGMTFASYLIRVRLNEHVEPKYVAFAINSRRGRDYIAAVRSQQVGQANVNGSKLAAFPLLLPPIEVQRASVAEVERQSSISDAMTATIGSSLQRAGELRQVILNRAVSGTLAASPKP